MARRSKIKKGSAKASRRRQRKLAGLIQARRKKEFTYRGFSVAELQTLENETPSKLIELLPARIRRTLTRGLNEEQKVFVKRLYGGDKAVLKTHRRAIPILPNFVGKQVAVYNGREYVEFEIIPEMIGHYLGEFALTRRNVKHSGPGVGATRSSKHVALK